MRSAGIGCAERKLLSKLPSTRASSGRCSYLKAWMALRMLPSKNAVARMLSIWRGSFWQYGHTDARRGRPHRSQSGGKIRSILDRHAAQKHSASVLRQMTQRGGKRRSSSVWRPACAKRHNCPIIERPFTAYEGRCDPRLYLSAITKTRVRFDPRVRCQCGRLFRPATPRRLQLQPRTGLRVMGPSSGSDV